MFFPIFTERDISPVQRERRRGSNAALPLVGLIALLRSRVTFRRHGNAEVHDTVQQAASDDKKVTDHLIQTCLFSEQWRLLSGLWFLLASKNGFCSWRELSVLYLINPKQINSRFFHNSSRFSNK